MCQLRAAKAKHAEELGCNEALHISGAVSGNCAHRDVSHEHSALELPSIRRSVLGQGEILRPSITQVLPYLGERSADPIAREAEASGPEGIRHR